MQITMWKKSLNRLPVEKRKKIGCRKKGGKGKTKAGIVITKENKAEKGIKYK